MGLRLVPKSVTLNDLERRNGRYFALFYEFGRCEGQLSKKLGCRKETVRLLRGSVLAKI